MSFHLPGNPFDPRDACTYDSKTYRDSIDDYISDEGTTDATLIYLGISELTHESRNANRPTPVYEVRDLSEIAGRAA